MRDFTAGLLAIALLLVAASLATTLHHFRRRRRQARDVERDRGRAILVELPTDEELVLFCEDARQFHYGSRAIDKDRIVTARVLINGSPIAATTARRLKQDATAHPTSFEDRPEGIARDRWDVAVETVDGMVLVECGAIRERVSQELARAVYDAIKRAMDELDRAAGL